MSPPGAIGDAADEVGALVPDIETLARRLADVDYLVDEGLATSIFLSLRLPQPLLLEGEAGVGKTEAAKSLALALDTPLHRLQCYEGIDAAEALYEWNYPRQLLSIRLADSRDASLGEEELFGALELAPQLLDLPRLVRVGQVVGLEAVVHCDAERAEPRALLLRYLRGAVREVADVADARLHHEAFAEVTGDGLGFRG